MKQLTEQLQKYFSAEGEEAKTVEKKKFFRLLTVKIFEYSINDKDINQLYEDFKKEMIEQKVKQFNKLQRAFSTIGEVLF